MVQTSLATAKVEPLVLISWLTLVALEDLPEFSDLTGVPAEHLIQSLLYRLRERGEEMSGRRVQETVKVKGRRSTFRPVRFHPVGDSFCDSGFFQRVLTHVLLRVDR